MKPALISTAAVDPSATDNGLPVWCFTGADMWALTGDEAGAALPDDLGPWAFRKRLTIDPTNADEAEALALIREHGFCCFDPIPAGTEA